MKRIVSICIIICTLAASSAVLYREKKPLPQPEETQTAEFTIMPDPEPLVKAAAENTAVFRYLIKDCDGKVVVYTADTMEIYMETGIRTDALPEELRDRLAAGIGFFEEPELFDFLESYSS